VWVLVACAPEPWDTYSPPDDCPDIMVEEDVAATGDGERTVEEMLSFVEEEWSELTVTWADGSRSSVDVTVAVGDQAEALVENDGCDDSTVVVTGLDLEVRIDDDLAVVSGLAHLGFGADVTAISDQRWSSVEAELLDGPFAQLDAATFELAWLMSDQEPDELILGDAAGEVFVCDEAVHGDCLVPR